MSSAHDAPAPAPAVDTHDDGSTRAGSVFVLRGLFVADRLASDAPGRVATLARAARAHPESRVRVEVMSTGATTALAATRARTCAAALLRALVTAGVARDRVELVPTALAPSAPRRDERVEVELIRAATP